MEKPVYVGLAIIGAKPGERATEEIGRFDTVAEAEEFLATSATIDQDRLAAGDYCIDAPEEMMNPRTLPEPTNVDRSENAYRAVLYYQQHGGDPDTGTAIEDLITDLLHLSDDYCTEGAEAICRVALMHYEAEHGGDDDPDYDNDGNLRAGVDN